MLGTFNPREWLMESGKYGHCYWSYDTILYPYTYCSTRYTPNAEFTSTGVRDTVLQNICIMHTLFHEQEFRF